MIDTIYTNGCSWTYGCEIQLDNKFVEWLESQGKRLIKSPKPSWQLSMEDLHGAQIPESADRYFNKFNWTGRVAERLNIENIVNESEGGGSNARIVRHTVNFLKKYPKDKLENLLVIIGWTHAERDEICVDINGPTWEIFNPNRKFSENTVSRTENISDRDRELNEFHKCYMTFIKNHYASVYSYFQNQYLLAGMLTGLGVKFLFFNGIPAWFDGGELKYQGNPYTEFAEDINWQNNQLSILNIHDTFFKFVHANKLPMAPDHHPLIDGHQQWGDYLVDTLINRKIINVQ